MEGEVGGVDGGSICEGGEEAFYYVVGGLSGGAVDYAHGSAGSTLGAAWSRAAVGVEDYYQGSAGPSCRFEGVVYEEFSCGVEAI